MSRYTFPVILILLAVAVYGVYVDPLYSAIQRDLVKESEVKAALVESDQAKKKLDEITRRYENFPADADQKLSEIIPEKIDRIRLLIEPTTFLEENGFPAESIVVASGPADTKDAPYRTHSITFSISASYDTFREFLHVLESSLVLRDMAMVSFDVAPTVSLGGSAKPELAIHKYNIKIIGYSLH